MIKNSTNRPLCVVCRKRLGRKAGVSVSGIQKWRKYCGVCDNKKYKKIRDVSLTCTMCGWTAKDRCQIDTVDGLSICSNCNRLRIKQISQSRKNKYEITVDATLTDLDLKI